MLVVADQGARIVGRQGRLAGARQPEKDCGVAVGADIGRGVHRQHAARRQDEIQIAEDRFLDLAGIGGAADQHQPLGEIDEDEGLRVDPIEFGDREEIRCVQDREGRLEPFQLGHRRTDEHVARKQAVPGAVADHPHRQPVGRIGAGIEVLHEQLAPLQIGEHALVQAGEALGRHRLVDLAPPHRVFGSGLLDDVFVARGAPGIGAGIDRKAAAEGELAFAAPDRVLVEHRRRLVPMHGSEMPHALPLEPVPALYRGHRIALVIRRFLLLRTGQHRTSAPALIGAVA